MKPHCLYFLLAFASSNGMGALRDIPIGVGELGNSSLAAPFQTSTSSRLQQVYLANAFGLHSGEGFLVREIGFRIDEQLPIPLNATFPDFQVNLSMTTRGPDELSRTYADNIGVNDTVVFGRGPLTISAFAGGGFGVRIPFARPFLYDPTVGNLLLDISNFQPSTAPAMDAVAVLGDSVSIVGGHATDPEGLTFTSGLATEFEGDIVLIPEPSTCVLMAISVFIWVRLGCRSNKLRKRG